MNIPEKYRIEVRERFLKDLRWRMMSGSVVYLFCWVFFLIPFNGLLAMPIEQGKMWQGALLLWVAAGARALGIWHFMAQALKTQSLSVVAPIDWRIALGLALNALSWSFLMAMILHVEEFAVLREPALMICGILYAFISISLSIDLQQLRLFLMTFTLPIGLAIVTQWRPHDILAGGLLVISLYPVYRFCRLHHREYWRQLLTRFQLKDSAERLDLMSRTDVLTGLFNRRHFNLQLQRLRLQGPLGILLLDLDHFKQINDKQGHPAGDLCLTRIGQLLQSCLPSWAFAARYGGEEFAILLPEADVEQTLAIAQRIRGEVEELRLVYQNQSFGVTVSIGASWCLAGELSAAEILQQVDGALYVAKAQGRNCIRLVTKDNQRDAASEHGCSQPGDLHPDTNKKASLPLG
ncbi:GGDEF domain-containing protein [Shewanella sp. YIC-542]|uniref:GGDEF domain-containing protein n=1 Tax=Shewanella mytili TaxID=3377111 RepID=UPI00398ECBA8